MENRVQGMMLEMPVDRDIADPSGMEVD